MAIPASVRRFVRERASLLCEYCHANERWQFVLFTLDHVTPQSAGGSDDPENLALACRNCNERRGDRLFAPDPATGIATTIFDPRQHRWRDHFAWDRERVRIVALTPIGRATVSLLDMNDERHGERVLRVRHRDLGDGFHPPADDPVEAS